MTIAETSNFDKEKIKKIVPAKLYKYRSWNDDDGKKFHKKILTEQQLYFSNPTTFEDIFDCRFPIKFDWEEETVKSRMIKSYSELQGLHVLQPHQLKSLIDYEYVNKFKTEEQRRQKESEFYKLHVDSLGIYCLSKANDNKTMWEKYCDGFTGFCVGLSLHDGLEHLPINYFGGGDVKYVPRDEEPLHYIPINEDEILALNTFINSIMIKYENEWSFENEYRLFKINMDYLNQHNMPKFESTLTVPKECYFEITFGYKMEQKYRDEIIHVCKKNNLPVKFSVAELHGDAVLICAVIP